MKFNEHEINIPVDPKDPCLPTVMFYLCTKEEYEEDRIATKGIAHHGSAPYIPLHLLDPRTIQANEYIVEAPEEYDIAAAVDISSVLSRTWMPLVFTLGACSAVSLA